MTEKKFWIQFCIISQDQRVQFKQTEKWDLASTVSWTNSAETNQRWDPMRKEYFCTDFSAAVSINKHTQSKADNIPQEQGKRLCEDTSWSPAWWLMLGCAD